MAAALKPFDLPDFAEPRRAEAGEPRIDIDPAAIEAARSEGVMEGRRLAMETIAADEAASLARIADALEMSRGLLAEARARDRTDTLTTARHFLEEFASGLAEAREIDAALDLLRRLTAQSDDRRPVNLTLARASRARLGPKLGAALTARRLDDFVSIDDDPALAPGELRLSWRGGEARRTRQEIREAAAEFVRSLDATREDQP